jgi:thiol:disulfide interchange protein DsbD
MKTLPLLLFCFLGVATLGQAQDKANPVKWTFSVQKGTDKEYDLVFTADILEDWHIYGMMNQGEGPVPTSLNLNFVDGFEFVGGPKVEGNKTTAQDKVFKKELTIHQKQVRFIQRIQNYGELKTLSGYVRFTACDGRKCLPPANIEFVFELK